MHPVRKKRLITISLTLATLVVAVTLVMYALSQNINLFYSPTQIANDEAPQGVMIHAGGMVVDGSVARDSDILDMVFSVTDYAYQVVIRYHGILPDLFRERQGIVAQGKLNSDEVLIASEVLAKHDEEHMPPEITEALKQSKFQ